jgi:uncharacterized protein YkwD
VRRVPLLLAVLLLVLAPVTAEAGPVTPAEQAQPAAKKVGAQKYAQQAVRATNKQRARYGLRRLTVDPCLRRFAARQAQAQANAQEMYHQDLGPVLSTCGKRTVGENVAYGFGNGRSVVDQGWMNSQGHRDNILNKSYRRVGIGARQAADGRWYVAQVFGG